MCLEKHTFGIFLLLSCRKGRLAAAQNLIGASVVSSIAAPNLGSDLRKGITCQKYLPRAAALVLINDKETSSISVALKKCSTLNDTILKDLEHEINVLILENLNRLDTIGTIGTHGLIYFIPISPAALRCHKLKRVKLRVWGLRLLLEFFFKDFRKLCSDDKWLLK